jgi:hypothetical protein
VAVGRDITYDRGANGVFPVRTGQGQCKPGIALMSILGEGGGQPSKPGGPGPRVLWSCSQNDQ